MDDKDSAKIKKLKIIGNRAISVFIGCVIVVFVIMLGGGFIVAIIGGIAGHKEWIRVVVAPSGIAAAIGAFSYGLVGIMEFWIIAVELRSQLITLREAISGFIAYGFVILFAIFCGCVAIWYWAIPWLIGPEAGSMQLCQ